MNLMMKRRLQVVLEAYGADPARWPDDDRKLFSGVRVEAGEALNSASELDRILGMSSAVPLPEQAVDRLLRATASANGAGKVVAFRRRDPRPTPWLGWLAAAPLAASLALGIYLGSQGFLDNVLPAQLSGLLAAVDDSTSDPGDITEFTDYSGGEVS
jgi:hypothetical protein